VIFNREGGIVMKRIAKLLICLVFFGVISISVLPAEEVSAGEEKTPPWLWLGPRIGVTGEISKPSDFDDRIQEFQPKSRDYFPVYSEIGLAIEQSIQLDQKEHRLFVQERILVGGLDQTMVLPSLSLLLGYRAASGLQIGLGPDFSYESDGGDAELAAAMVYTLGGSFTLDGKKIPIVLSAVPIPPEGKPRLSILTGLDFGFSFKREKEQTPFNY
jgi:hypothetical protein